MTDITTGKRIPLERHTDASTEAPRYRIVSMEGGQIRAEPIGLDAVGDFYPDHRHECENFPA